MIFLWSRLRPVLSTFVRFLHISYLEARSQYQATRLGLLWIPFSTLIFTAILALVFRTSETISASDFFLYVLSGYTLWIFVQSSIVSSTDVIQKKLEFATHNNLSLAGLFGKFLVDRLFQYGINLFLLILALATLSPEKFGIEAILILPFLAIIVSTSLAVAYLVNITTIFSPDMATLIKTGARFLFFASPIFWVASEGTGVRIFLLAYNPVSYYLGMCRQVFGIEPLSASSWVGSIVLCFVLCTCGYITYKCTHSFVRNIK